MLLSCAEKPRITQNHDALSKSFENESVNSESQCVDPTLTVVLLDQDHQERVLIIPSAQMLFTDN